MIKFKVQVDGLKLDLGQLQLNKFKKIAKQELENTKDRLTRNIKQGKDAEGNSLAPYSPAYRKAIKKGYAKSLGATKARVHPVDLTISNTMLNSRTTKELFNGAELVFTGNHGGISNEELAKSIMHPKKSAKHPNRKVNPRTGWHSLGKKDLERIKNRIDKEIEKISKNLIKKR